MRSGLEVPAADASVAGGVQRRVVEECEAEDGSFPPSGRPGRASWERLRHRGIEDAQDARLHVPEAQRLRPPSVVGGPGHIAARRREREERQASIARVLRESSKRGAVEGNDPGVVPGICRDNQVAAAWVERHVPDPAGGRIGGQANVLTSLEPVPGRGKRRICLSTKPAAVASHRLSGLKAKRGYPLPQSTTLGQRAGTGQKVSRPPLWGTTAMRPAGSRAVMARPQLPPRRSSRGRAPGRAVVFQSRSFASLPGSPRIHRGEDVASPSTGAEPGFGMTVVTGGPFSGKRMRRFSPDSSCRDRRSGPRTVSNSTFAA